MIKEQLINWEEYECYEDKRIWSKWFKKYLKGSIAKDGYVNVVLKCIDGKRRTFLWHRVIWTYFNGPIPEGYEINHLDENKQNNRLSNLSLTSHVENCNWKSRNERVAAKLRGRKLSEEHKAKLSESKKGNKYCLGRKLSEETKGKISERQKGKPKFKLINHPLRSKAVVAVDKEGNVIYEFPSTMEAGRNGFSRVCVAACCNGKLKTHKGLRWYFKSDWLEMQKPKKGIQLTLSFAE